MVPANIPTVTCLLEPPREVAAIDGAEAGRPGQVHPAETEYPLRLRIVVSQAQRDKSG